MRSTATLIGWRPTPSGPSMIWSFKQRSILLGGWLEAAGRYRGSGDGHSSPDRQHAVVGRGARDHALGWAAGQCDETPAHQGFLQSHTRCSASDAKDPAHDLEATAGPPDRRIPRAHWYSRGGGGERPKGCSEHQQDEPQGHVCRLNRSGLARRDRTLLWSGDPRRQSSAPPHTRRRTVGKRREDLFYLR